MDKTKEMFIHVSRNMVESKDILTQADKAIGDGDHGIGMARGFEAVEKKLANQDYENLSDLLASIGMTLMGSIGGAAGAVFGTFFKGGAKNLKDQKFFDIKALSIMLQDGLQAVEERGKAKPGDKTMIDALEPAKMKSIEVSSQPLVDAIENMAEAARQGMENTKDMIATTGKAKTLGERSLGHPDPGAVSMYLILKFMHEYVLKVSK
ncbi:MAG: dihydroxyacetone kinase subunit L [Deltaproteobacteria bacterium]|nr:dihydroxyacetone kinase subunit L [Deltaproteobacteria bacterium]